MMKTVKIKGFKRENLGTKRAKRLRNEGYAPGVLYGSGRSVHFYVPMLKIMPLIDTASVYFVDLELEGESTPHTCILQAVQRHPVSEMILHIDMLAVQPTKRLKMAVPLRLTGTSPGVLAGGTIQVLKHRIVVEALPKELPSEALIDISALELGQSGRIKDIVGDFTCMDPGLTPVVKVMIPRALRTKEAEKS